MTDSARVYKRILLKLSGEALSGKQGSGIDPLVLHRLAGEICEIAERGVQIGLVIGGGNLFRGAALATAGLDRVTGDQMGMLATVMNSMAMQNALERAGTMATLMSAIPMGALCEVFNRNRAIRYLNKGQVVIFSAGTGNPFFTTDSAASLRAIEIGAQVMLKATKVDGVYSDDPVKNPKAIFFRRLSYDEILEKKLMVMDATAIVLCRNHGMPLRVFNLNKKGNLLRVVSGDDIGTIVEPEITS
ncbi:MAG: UMP kinase [Gammaproteobacteria bacterium]